MPTGRTRQRKESITIDRQEIFTRVDDFFKQDLQDRDLDREQRLQRYAKYRMWVEGKDWPWADASDVPLSDMMEKSLRLQDTLNNAVISQRPAIESQATVASNKDKQKTIDGLIDYQFFEEQNGEFVIGELADAFVNDGVFTAFVPWVREKKNQADVRLVDPIPEGVEPQEYFERVMDGIFPRSIVTPVGSDPNPWDYKIVIPANQTETDEPKEITAKFYTRDNGMLELIVESDMIIFDGPQVRQLDFDDVFHPARAANLQPPGPSNPGGASHVIIRDFPTIDEIQRLKKNGFYDLITDDDMDKIEKAVRTWDETDQEETQKDDLSGNVETNKDNDTDKTHNRLTRLICFDTFDIDDDGLNEDVIFWVIHETKTVVKAAVLQEHYPLNPKRPRPFAEASIIPVRGRRVGISLLEMMEGLHDVMKQMMDQIVDSGTISIAPFFFYRPTSSTNPESIALQPGEGYPLGNPQQDVVFPSIGNTGAQGTMLNLFTMIGQMEERVTTIGDLQLGRVPAGKSSALRTSANMASVQSQGEARPERILRRFFNGLTQIWEIYHDLNMHFLPKGKQFRIAGGLKPNEDPYTAIERVGDIQGQFAFTFKANVLNTSKQQMQETMERLLGTYLNEISIQTGIVRPENIYSMYLDYGKAFGADPEPYLSEPLPGLVGPRITAGEAVIMILNDQAPFGGPMEAGGWAEHLQELIAIEEQFTDPKVETGEITPSQAAMLQGYKLQVEENAAAQQRQEQMAAAAAQAGQQGGGGQPAGRPTENFPQDPNAQAPLSGGNELIDESLPTAGGGAN